MKKHTPLLILSIALLLSLVGNWYQNKLRKDDRIAQELATANSNTLIAANRAIAEQKQAAIDGIRKERTSDSLENAKETGALKRQISGYRKKLETLPKTVVYNPDSSTVDSLRLAFSLKDSTINTQALMIMSMEVEKTGIFDSFHREILQLEQKQAAQVEISNQLQNQLVTEQGESRKWEKKAKKKFSVTVTGGYGVMNTGGEIRTGPVISGGISYRLFRF